MNAPEGGRRHYVGDHAAWGSISWCRSGGIIALFGKSGRRFHAATVGSRAMQSIKAHSPQSWAHINMLGEYDFSDKKLADSFGTLPLKNGT
jgi:hypothetical protein